MANNTITIELCAEDRQRLNILGVQMATLIAALTGKQPKTEEPKQETPKAEEPKADTAPWEEPKQEAPKAEEPKQEAAPTYKLADIQQKVVQLSAGGKKAEVREIVKAYAEKVSAIPADKFDEVMGRLIGLEG